MKVIKDGNGEIVAYRYRGKWRVHINLLQNFAKIRNHPKRKANT